MRLLRRSILSALFSEITITMIPITAFVIGITGSLHCVAMCGALSTSCTTSNSHQYSYHGGRITSYGVLGLICGMLGLTFQSFFNNPYVKNIPSFFLSILFIYWGHRLLKGKKPSILLPKKMSSILQKNFAHAYRLEKGIRRAFSIGFLSAFLPCGLLYGVLMSLTIFQSPIIGLVGMVFFALGTIPALFASPILIKKILRPLHERSPKLTSLSLISLGLITIFYRLSLSYEQILLCH